MSSKMLIEIGIMTVGFIAGAWIYEKYPINV